MSYSPAESGFTKRPLTGSASECLGRPSNLCLSRAITTIFVPVTSWKVRFIVPFFRFCCLFNRPLTRQRKPILHRLPTRFFHNFHEIVTESFTQNPPEAPVLDFWCTLPLSSTVADPTPIDIRRLFFLTVLCAKPVTIL